MKSRATKRFWAAYGELSHDDKHLAREAYLQFSNDPSHPSLKFKCVHASKPIYSVRISRGIRALGVLSGESITWFWIGSHDDYERLLSRT